jgi:hypothetical protein
MSTSKVKTPSESKSINIDELKNWLNKIYDIGNANQEFINQMSDAFSYKGFNREEVLTQLYGLNLDPSVVIQIITVGALRGPQAAVNIRLLNGKTPKELGIPASGGKGSKILTMNKIVSATADLAAFYLKRIGLPKRVNVELPAWLQFPSAGSIKLPANLRAQHIEFHKKFSPLIGGAFQEQIYLQMEANSYLDERLSLF